MNDLWNDPDLRLARVAFFSGVGMTAALIVFAFLGLH